MKLSKAIKQIQSGKLAIKNDKFSKFKKCIKYIFSKDDECYKNIHGEQWIYAFADDIDEGEWDASMETELPTIKASKLWNKIRNELADGHMEAVLMFNYMYEDFVSTASNKVETPDNPCTWGSKTEQPKDKDFLTKRQRGVLHDFLTMGEQQISRDHLYDVLRMLSEGYVPISYEWKYSPHRGASTVLTMKGEDTVTMRI